MFRKNIERTALVCEDTDGLFRIDGDSFYGDVSFVSTLRALLGHKMKEDDHLTLRISQSRTGANDYAFDTNDSIIRMFFDPDAQDRISVVNFLSSDADNQKFFDAIEHISEHYPKWTRVGKVTEFYAKNKIKLIAFSNREAKATAVFTWRFDLRKWHAFQGAVYALIPWYFSGDYARTDDEKTTLIRPLIESLLDADSPDAYLAITKKIADEKYDIRKARINRMIGDYETRILKRKIRDRDQEKESINEQIRSYMHRISDFRMRLFDLNAEVIGYKAMLNSSEPGELSRFFTANNNLHLVNADGNTIRFIVRGHLSYFPDTTEDVIAKKDNYIYAESDGTFDPADMELLLRAVCVDRTIKLRSCAYIVLNTSTFEIERDECRRFRFDDVDGFESYMPNVHIDQYGCFGDNGDCVHELLAEGRPLEAIEQCCAAASNLDLNDYSVGTWFIDHLCQCGQDNNYHRNVRAFELPDGRVVMPAEAIEYLKGN